MRCPKCKNKVLQKTGGKTKLRSGGPIEWTDGTHVRTKCHWCKEDISVPLRVTILGEPLTGERFVLATGKRGK